MELTKVKLGDYLEEFGDGIHGTPNYDENGEYYFINGNNLDNGAILIDSETKRISSDEYDSIKRNLNNRTLLLSINGTLGRLAYYNGENIALGKSACFLNFKENTDRRYFRYILEMKDFRLYMSKVASGSTIKNFSPRQAADYEFFAPKPDDQKKIASVLSALDDKIALNKKMNQKLEAMAKRLYDYWFVQYDFPDKNGHPYKTTGGPMTYNPTLKREIPAGWEVVDINELCQVVDCLHSKKPDFCYEDENSYLLALENITKEGYIDLSDKYYISKKDFAEWTSRICVRENDFLFTNAGRAGDMGMVPEGVLCAIGRNITAVRPEKINPWYLRCFFKSLYMQEQILNNLDQGSFFMSFNVRSIKKLQVLMPSELLMKKFISFVEPHLKRIEKNNKEISRLTKLRDKLLPLLMNGQVEVK